MTNKAIYEHEAQDIANLVLAKKQAYGEHSLEQVNDIIKILYPTGISSEDYSKVLIIVRLLDKVTRLVTAHHKDKEDAWKDIAGYALRMLVLDQEIKPKLDRRNE